MYTCICACQHMQSSCARTCIHTDVFTQKDSHLLDRVRIYVMYSKAWPWIQREKRAFGAQISNMAALHLKQPSEIYAFQGAVWESQADHDEGPHPHDSGQDKVPGALSAGGEDEEPQKPPPWWEDNPRVTNIAAAKNKLENVRKPHTPPTPCNCSHTWKVVTMPCVNKPARMCINIQTTDFCILRVGGHHVHVHSKQVHAYHVSS
jgi:hypothetical protein